MNAFIVIVVVFVITLFDDSVYIFLFYTKIYFIEKVVEDFQSCFCTLTDVCTSAKCVITKYLNKRWIEKKNRWSNPFHWEQNASKNYNLRLKLQTWRRDEETE